MAQYYFDIRDQNGFHQDNLGDDLANFAEARHQAQGLLADLVRDELPDGDRHVVSCDVRDDTGRIVYHGEIVYTGERY